MAVRIVQKINVQVPGLKAGHSILRDELNRAGDRIGKRLQTKVREKQRVDTGEERRRTRYTVKTSRGSLLTVSVYNTVVQALVDETGATWSGKMPPYKIGSKLFSWVLRKGLARSYSKMERRFISSFD